MEWKKKKLHKKFLLIATLLFLLQIYTRNENRRKGGVVPRFEQGAVRAEVVRCVIAEQREVFIFSWVRDCA